MMNHDQWKNVVYILPGRLPFFDADVKNVDIRSIASLSAFPPFKDRFVCTETPKVDQDLLLAQSR
jgi:hypothetical protein